MATLKEFKYELECHTVHVCHRQNADDLVALFEHITEHVHGKIVVAPYCPVGYHDSLGESCSAAGVVDECQFIGALLVVVADVLSAEKLGVFPAEHLVEVFACVCKFICARQGERVVGNIYDTFKSRHLGGIHLCGDNISHKENLRLTMIHNIMNLFGCELM